MLCLNSGTKPKLGLALCVSAVPLCFLLPPLSSFFPSLFFPRGCLYPGFYRSGRSIGAVTAGSNGVGRSIQWRNVPAFNGGAVAVEENERTFACPKQLRFPMSKASFNLVLFNYRMETVETSSTDQHIMDQSDEVLLDINELAISLREKLKIKKAFSPECCIYRVPERLRKLNEKAYTPRVVSRGPIHHGKENLKAMEDHRIMYLQQFLGQNKVSVEDLINIIKENETALRDCYAETISLSRKDFATMILLDAVFIIMVLLNSRGFLDSGRRDHIFYRPFKLDDVMLDMSLLENRLPFFILQKLFELSSAAANPENCTLFELTCGFLNDPWSEWVKDDSWKIIDSSGVLHFVDLLRKCQEPTEKHRPKKEGFSSPPTATELHQSGVKFKRPEKSSFIIRHNI